MDFSSTVVYLLICVEAFNGDMHVISCQFVFVPICFLVHGRASKEGGKCDFGTLPGVVSRLPVYLHLCIEKGRLVIK